MLQFFLMVGAIVAVLVLGVYNLKDPWDIWTDAERGGRLIFFE